MWQKAIKAVKKSDEEWIRTNRRAFRSFFENENLKPQGKLNENALQEHYRSRLFKMYLSKSFNGLELPLETGSRWIENATLLDSNWGWLLAIGVGGAYFADYMVLEIAEKFYLPENSLVAGSGKPNGKAVSLNNSECAVSGSWSYCSGAEQASLFTAVTSTNNGTSAVILPVDLVDIQRDWNAIGLPLTCSHSIVAKNIKIPKNYFFDLSLPPRKTKYPLATYPFMLFARSCFVPVLLGISRAFWTEVLDLLEKKEIIWKKYQPERFELVLETYQDFDNRLQNTRTEFYGCLKRSWEEHISGGDILEEEITEKSYALADFCYEACAGILPALGMEVLQMDHPVQLLWRDLQTARQHAVFQRYN